MVRFSMRVPDRIAPTYKALALLVLAVLVYMPLHPWLAEPIRMSGHAGAEPSVRPATIVTPIACTPLPDIAGKSITTAVVHFPPNAYTPKHRHPGSVTAYVLSGTIQSQIAGERAETYSTGQTWFEPTGAVHSFAHNISFTEDADLLAIFVADTNCGPLTIFD